MDNPSKRTLNLFSKDRMSTQQKSNSGTIDDYFREIGIEPSSVKLEIEYGTSEETNQEKRDAHQQRMEFYRFIVKEASVYAIGCLLVIALTVVSTSVLLNKNSSSESQAWAKSTLTALVTAIAGYVFGKSNSS
jgi:cation transport ATPase